MVNNGGAVLIHSRRGMNRAVVLAIAYLMDKYSWTLDKAARYYESKVHKEDMYQVKEWFLKQLREYENYLKFEENRNLTNDFNFDKEVNTEEQMLVNTWINSQSKMKDRMSLCKENSMPFDNVYRQKSGKRGLTWATQVANVIPLKENLNININEMKKKAKENIKNHQQDKNLDKRIKNYLKGSSMPKRGSTPAKMCNGLGKRIKNLKNILNQNRKSKPKTLNSLTTKGFGNKLEVPGKKSRRVNHSLNSLKDSKEMDTTNKRNRNKTPAKISIKNKKKNVNSNELKKMEKLIKSIEHRNKIYHSHQNNFISDTKLSTNQRKKMINSVSTNIKPFTPSKKNLETFRSGSVIANREEGKSQNQTPVTNDETLRLKTESDERVKKMVDNATINNLGDQIKSRIQSRSRSRRKEKKSGSGFEVKPDDKSPIAKPIMQGAESNDEYNFMKSYNEVKRTGSTQPNYYYTKGDSYMSSVNKNNKSSKANMIKVKIEDAYKFVSPRTTRGLNLLPKREGSGKFNHPSFTRKSTFEVQKHHSKSNQQNTINSEPKIKILGDKKQANGNTLQIPTGRVKTSRSPRKTRNTTQITPKTCKSILNSVLVTGQSRRQSVAKSQNKGSRYKRSSVAVS